MSVAGSTRLGLSVAISKFQQTTHCTRNTKCNMRYDRETVWCQCEYGLLGEGLECSLLTGYFSIFTWGSAPYMGESARLLTGLSLPLRASLVCVLPG